MKNYFNYDFINKAIVGTKTAIRKANAGNTPEYRELCKKLATYCDIYVNDAFGTAHRSHATTAAIAEYGFAKTAV